MQYQEKRPVISVLRSFTRPQGDGTLDLMLIFSIYTTHNHQQHYSPNEQCDRFFACFGIIWQLVYFWWTNSLGCLIASSKVLGRKVYFFWEKNKCTFLLIICIGWFFQCPQTVIIIFLKQETHFIYIEKKIAKKRI